MKKTVVLYIVMLLVSCTNQSQRQKSIDQINCKSYLTYNNKSFCLPKFEGMTECISNVIIKEWIQQTNLPGAIDLAFYLNDNIYEKLESIDGEIIDDYFRISAYKNLEGHNISRSYFNKLSSSMEVNMIKKRWEDVKKSIEQIGADFKIDQPVLLEAYCPKDNVKTLVMFSRYINDIGESYKIIVSNLLLIDQSLFMLSYYKNYKEEESIGQAKIKSDFIVSRFIDENK